MDSLLLWASLFGNDPVPVKTKSKKIKNEKFIRTMDLFALSKNGNIRTHWITIEDMGDHAVLTTHKQMTLGGKVIEDSYEYWEGVNIGKSNETTYFEQAKAEANSIINNLYDSGYSNIKPDRGEKFNVDAEGNMKPMLASSDISKIVYPCLVQPKYDGVRCIMLEENGKILLLSRKGKPYEIPHLKEWAMKNKHLLPLDGELYNHGEFTFQQIISAVKKVSPLTDKIRYAVYDRPVEGFTNKERWRKLVGDFENVPSGSPAYLSDYVYCDNFEQLKKYHEKCVANGYEGVIIRNSDGVYEFGFRSNNLIKYKEFEVEEFKIVDVVEATGRDEGTAIFVCSVSGHEDDIAWDESNSFRVKPQGTREQRKEYFDNPDYCIGKMLSVQFQGLTDDGKPRFPSGIAIRDYE